MNRKLRRLPDWIEDIRCAIGNIRNDTSGLTKAQFLDDGKSQRAVAKSISDIGEAANRSRFSMQSYRKAMAAETRVAS
jgi:uncharacterized protein with HEPN domain